MLAVQSRWQPGGILGFMKDLPAATPPGGAWTYNTGESYLVGAVMEAATGVSLADYLSDRIWSRAGMAMDARWWSEAPDGLTISGSGMNACLGDYARFGQFVLEGGRIGDAHLLPDGPAEELVVVVASARAKPGYRRRLEINDDAFFAAVARALKGS